MARDASALKKTVWPTTGRVCETTNDAVGAADAEVDTDCLDDADRPRSLVTVRITLKVPTVLKVCCWLKRADRAMPSLVCRLGSKRTR